MSEESGDQGGELDTSTQDSGSAVATSPAESSQESPSGTSSGSPPQGDAVWGSFRQLPEFQGQDDRSIASYLYQAMQRERVAQQKLAQYQQYIPYAQEYLAHRPEFEKWKSSQTGSQAQQADQLQAAQPQVEKAWWNPPEIKDSYKKYLTKDENGRDVIAENAPLDARSALEDWMQYRADFARKFLENPQETLGPMVEKLAQQQAEKIVQDRFDTERKQAFVTNVEQENRDWLFDHETGQVSPEGMLVHKYIDEARSQGIQGPEARWKYAVAMTERDMLAMAFDQQQAMQAQQAQYAAQPAYQPPAMQAPQAPAEPPPQPKPDLAQQNMEYLRREAARNPSRSAGTQLTDPRAPKPKRTFEQFFKDQAMQDGLL
jgi:hypothetical protein